jgi:hypothetical protein
MMNEKYKNSFSGEYAYSANYYKENADKAKSPQN